MSVVVVGVAAQEAFCEERIRSCRDSEFLPGLGGLGYSDLEELEELDDDDNDKDDELGRSRGS